MGMMQSQLNEFKEIANEVQSLRAEINSLGRILGNKVNKNHQYLGARHKELRFRFCCYFVSVNLLLNGILICSSNGSLAWMQLILSHEHVSATLGVVMFELCNLSM